MSQYWKNHGTKILGFIVIAFGVLGDFMGYMETADPKHASIYTAIAVLGGLIVKRGFTNSAANKDPK